jgi:hypothetical protein
MPVFALAFGVAFGASNGPADALTAARDWPAGTIQEQMAADPTMVPFGKGAIFVPAMTNPLDEPPVSVWSGDKRIGEGTTGRRIIVAPGVYEVRLGSGTVQQRFSTTVTVRELFASVVPVEWAGLAVHVVDERLNSLRGSYELLRVEDREYLGIGFGTDEQAGEPVATWILEPGLYKIVRVGETYRARRDFATVRLLPGHLTHFQLVLDGDTGDFVGAGEVPSEELFLAQRGKLWTMVILGGDLSFNDRDNVPGTVSGKTWAFRAFADTQLSAEIFDSPFILRLQIEEGQTKTPDVPWQKTQDRADVDALYVYRFAPWIGPYLRGSVETNLLNGFEFFDSPTNVQVIDDEDGTVLRNRTGIERLRISSPLALSQIKEGAGLNVRLFKAIFGETTVRTGVGARHRLTRGLLERSDDDATAGVIEYRRIRDSDQVGIEGTLLTVFRITRWVVGSFEVDSLVPFDDVDQIVFEVEGNVAVKLTQYLSVNYVLRYVRDKSLSEKDQIEQDVRLRFSFELL